MYDVLLSDDSPSPDKELLSDSLRKEIKRALNTLTRREADIIRLYFGLTGKYGHTLEEIGEKFNITRERVRQIKEGAIKRLKHTARSRLLKTYLD
jgi:RNA polymerase primary sigma factor